MTRRREGRKGLTSISKDEEAIGDDQEEVEVAEEEGKGFFACYLLCSLCPRFKGHTYIGFTVNPRRRIRQHNGELRSGAWRTKSKRPWEMILCIYGFPTNVTALQFEWAWQHPTESLAVRKAAASLKALNGIVGKIKLAYTMLSLPPWQSLKLTVNFFSTKYSKDAVGCQNLPKQMKVQFCPMEELTCYTGCEQIFDEMDDEEDAENGSNPRQPGDPVPEMEENQEEAADTLRAPDHTPPFHVEERQPSPGNDILSSPQFSSDPIDLSSPIEEGHKPHFSLVDTPEPSRRTPTPTPTGADNYQPPSTKSLYALSADVEVIDISTPTPASARTISSSFRQRKRRNNWVSQEIVDLTKSPDIVQL